MVSEKSPASLYVGRKAPDRCRAVMVAIVGQQRQPQGQTVRGDIGSGPPQPGRVGGVGAGLHPDARLDPMIADLVRPYRDGVVEVEAADANMTRRRDGAALPAVGEQRPGMIARDEGRIGLREDQPTPQRRTDRRNQQTVIAPGQAAGDGPAGVAAETVCDPPFAPLGLAEIAADGAREADRTRHWPGGILVRVGAVHPEKPIRPIADSTRTRRAGTASLRQRQRKESRPPNQNSSGTAKSSDSMRHH